MKQSKIRERIIETASSLFYEKGYNSTGINEIIADAGIAKATLYSHFKSKEDLCIAYLKYKNNLFLTEIADFSRSKRKGKNQVLGLFDFLLNNFNDKDFNGCWCIKTVAEIPRENVKIREEIQLQKNLFLQLIRELITENLKKRSQGKLNTLARQIYLLYETAVGESHLHQDDWPIMEARKLCTLILA